MEGKIKVGKAYESILYGDFEQAIYWFEQAMEDEPDNAEYPYRCSISCSRSGKWVKALEYARRAVRLDPGHSKYAYQLGMVESRWLTVQAARLLESDSPDYAAACGLLEQAYGRDPLHTQALLLLAAAYDKQGRHSEALHALGQILKLEPGHAEAGRLHEEKLKETGELDDRTDQSSGCGRKRPNGTGSSEDGVGG